MHNCPKRTDPCILDVGGRLSPDLCHHQISALQHYEIVESLRPKPAVLMCSFNSLLCPDRAFQQISEPDCRDLSLVQYPEVLHQFHTSQSMSRASTRCQCPGALWPLWCEAERRRRPCRRVWSSSVCHAGPWAGEWALLVTPLLCAGNRTQPKHCCQVQMLWKMILFAVFAEQYWHRIMAFKVYQCWPFRLWSVVDVGRKMFL